MRLQNGLIDVIQLHGDESPADATPYRDAQLPFIKAIGVAGSDHLADAEAYGASALLMDAHAPGVYGGTGETFDWNTAVDFKQQHPGREALEQDSGRGLFAHTVWKFHHRRRRACIMRRIGTRPQIRDAISRREMRDPFPNSLDHARAL